MVVNELTKALQELCREAVKNFQLPTKGKELKAPQIVNGFLPPKKKDDKDDFPFVIVRPEECVSERGSEEIKVIIIVGCYSEEYDGFEYGLNVVTRIKEKLMTLPAETLNRKYQLTYPIKWNMIPEQPFPQWQLEIETNWVTNTPMNFDDF
jgi:hypothetical protein